MCIDNEEYKAMSHRGTKKKREKYWPTVCSSDYAGGGTFGSKAHLSQAEKSRLKGVVIEPGNNGQLNPEFCEWLMGYPKGWTVLNCDDIDMSSAGQWESEWEGTPRVASGVKQRANRIKCLGNAIVPQIAKLIFETEIFDEWKILTNKKIKELKNDTEKKQN
jgi:site-specific DNA-cytosine methylase